MSTSDKLPKETDRNPGPLIWPHPTNLPPPGGEWDPPPLAKDVAVLVPSGLELKDAKVLARKTDLLVCTVPGLDGKYVLSSDGSTRPYGEGH